MKLKLASLFLVVAFIFAFPISGFAQTPDGTFSDCMAKFEEAEGYWPGTVTSSYGANCWAHQGQAYARLYGDDGSDNYYFQVNLFKSGGVKRCVVNIRNTTQGENAYYWTYAVSGKDAARWNRWVKGDGCDDIYTLED